MMKSWRTLLTDSAPALIIALEFITLIDYRLHPLAWILPAMLLIGGKHEHGG